MISHSVHRKALRRGIRIVMHYGLRARKTLTREHWRSDQAGDVSRGSSRYRGTCNNIRDASCLNTTRIGRTDLGIGQQPVAGQFKDVHRRYPAIFCQHPVLVEQLGTRCEPGLVRRNASEHVHVVLQAMVIRALGWNTYAAANLKTVVALLGNYVDHATDC